jgi:hypothetical protein
MTDPGEPLAEKVDAIEQKLNARFDEVMSLIVEQRSSRSTG